MLMPWLPAPTDFRQDLRRATDGQPASDRLVALAALARHDLGFLETLQIDRAVARLVTISVDGFAKARVALLGAATVEHLAPAIRVAGLRRDMLIDVHVGPYGQYRQQIVDPQSPLASWEPQFVLLSLTARETLASVSVSADASEVDRALAGAIDELRRLWAVSRARFRATVIQQTFLNVAEPVFGSYDRMLPAAPTRLIDALNDRLADAAAHDGVLLLDVARASQRTGLAQWFDIASWLQAKVEVSHAATALYGDLVARVVAAQRGLSKKCLVLDLDNTLWGGVIGDDGLEGIVLGEGSARGEAHLAFQRYVKQLAERGVILAVCSKNELVVAESAFERHPEMVLRRDDIAAFVATWDDKATNVAAIASQLNIGLDALVFVDDNPAERARVREALPAVAVPELPDDVAHYAQRLAEAGYFEAVAFTPEDRRRVRQYAENASRQALLDASASLDDFLSGLDMSLAYGPFQAVDLSRIAQLVNKTNQFNPTTRRRTAQELAAVADASSGCLTLQLRLLDRFGDNGLVAAIILAPIADAPGMLEVDTWVMSCRVFGRELEAETMNLAVEAARSRGVTALRAEYMPTPKNGVVRDLYPKLGFAPSGAAPESGGPTRWVLSLSTYKPLPTRIRRVSAPR
jgi:FkbH-like protein